MSTTPTSRRASSRAEPSPPVAAAPGPQTRAGSRIRRLAARLGAAVRSAHSASVPF